MSNQMSRADVRTFAKQPDVSSKSALPITAVASLVRRSTWLAASCLRYIAHAKYQDSHSYVANSQFYQSRRAQINRLMWESTRCQCQSSNIAHYPMDIFGCSRSGSHMSLSLVLCTWSYTPSLLILVQRTKLCRMSGVNRAPKTDID